MSNPWPEREEFEPNQGEMSQPPTGRPEETEKEEIRTLRETVARLDERTNNISELLASRLETLKETVSLKMAEQKIWILASFTGILITIILLIARTLLPDLIDLSSSPPEPPK